MNSLIHSLTSLSTAKGSMSYWRMGIKRIVQSWSVTGTCTFNLVQIWLMDESVLSTYLVVLRLGRKLNMCCISLTSSIKVWILYVSFCSFFSPSFLASCRRQYHPLSLQKLQYLIDLGRVDPTQPIDLTQLTNARGVTVQPLKRDYGVQLVEEVCIQYKYIISGSIKPWVFSFFTLDCPTVLLLWKHPCFSKSVFCRIHDNKPSRGQYVQAKY